MFIENICQAIQSEPSHYVVIVKKKGSPSERESERRNAGTVGDLAVSPGGSARGQPCRGEGSSNCGDVYQASEQVAEITHRQTHLNTHVVLVHYAVG